MHDKDTKSNTITNSAVKNKRPLIGITLDWRPGDKMHYSVYDWYCVRQTYANAIGDLGGIPVYLPHNIESIAEYISHINGFVFTGCDNDIHPSHYGQKPITEDGQYMADRRYYFEKLFMEKILETGKPILAVCAGAQLLNVIKGGTLIQDIKTQISKDIEHSQGDARDRPAHQINISQDSLMYKLSSLTETQVNSSHHQAVDKPGRGIKIVAKSPD